MTVPPRLRLPLALTIGACGGALASVLGFPAPWLTGPAMLVTLVGVLALKASVPNWLRDGGFTIIGLSIGSGVDGTILARVIGWVPSLIAVVACSAAVMAASSAFMIRFGGVDRTTARLATSPGALGYAVAVAMEGRGDVTQVMLSQSTRLFAMTAIMPLLLKLSGEAMPAAAEHLSMVMALALFALAFPMGMLWARWRVPAGFLLAGMAVSAGAHLGGFAHGLAPTALTDPAYVVTGTMIGLRFGRNSLADLARLMPVALGCTGLAVAIAAVFAGAVTGLTGMPFAQAWIALAPGGVEAMAAMALALGFEPAFVAAHHLLRICFLSLVMPWWMGRGKKDGARPR